MPLQESTRTDSDRAARRRGGAVLAATTFLLLGAVSTAAATGAGGADAIAANEPVTFSVTGDIPYGSGEVSEFQQQVDEHDLYSPSELFFHVGDILSGSESCSESRYRTVANILESSEVPAYIVPGDNETIDCSNPSSGWTYWTRHLLGIESNWSCSPATSRQSGRTENFAFVRKGILFVGINLVGGDNSTSIMQDDASWVSQQLQQNVSSVRGAVIVAQAGPGGNRSTFFNPFVTAAKNFAKPILYIHGDGHSWKKDKPFSATNVTRVQVEQGGQELPVQVTATLSSSNMFEFLRDPWDEDSPLVSREPCGGGTTTPTLTITDASVTEGNSGSVNAVFTVTVTNLGSASVGVQYATANGTAQAGQDYTSKSGTLSFSGSTTSRTISVAVLGDTADEPDETFVVNLSNPSGATLADGQGVGTIRDDDDAEPTNTLVFAPAADAHIQVGSTSNYGGDAELRVKTDSSIYRAYLKFQLSGVGSFQAARLRFYVTDGTDVAGTMHAVSNNYEGTSTTWTEAGVNGVNAPTITAPTLASVGSTTSGTWIEFDVTTAISGDGTYSFALQSSSDSSGRYSSKEGANPPQLVLDLSGSDPGNTPPVAGDDSRNTAEDVVLSVATPGVLGNDTDPDGDPLTAVVVTNPAHGTLALQSNGGFTYTPQANYSGSDGFTYQARDGRGGSDVATVALTVTPQPDAPVAAAESYALQEGGSLTVPAPGVLGNDTDADGDALTASLGSDVAHGSLTLQGNGSFTYTPDAGFTGSDQFTYRASDGNLQSAATTVTLSVGATPSGTVTFMDVQTGGSTALATVATTGNVTGTAGDLFLASIATKPNRAVSTVTGLGLSWSRVRAQCGGRGQTSIEVWMARGTPSAGIVTATLASAVENATIAVARYAGCDATTPLGSVVSANPNGVDGTCSNGVDTPSYTLPVPTQIGSTLFGAVSMRGRTHTPGSGWTERLELQQGTGGGTAGIAVSERQATQTTHTFDGSFESTVDWSAIAIELRPSSSAAKIAVAPQADDAMSGFRLGRIAPNPAGKLVTLAYELTTPGAVEVTIYNARGQRLRTLTRTVQPAGRHETQWDLHDSSGQRVPAGVYFVRATLGPRMLQQKLVVQH